MLIFLSILVSTIIFRNNKGIVKYLNSIKGEGNRAIRLQHNQHKN